MTLPTTPPAVAPTLTEQKADFTAEGAPPPGKVSTAVPAKGVAVRRRVKARSKRSSTAQYP